MIAILNATIINEGKRFIADVLIKDERIFSIGTQLNTNGCTRVIDAKERLLLPGMIDDQVHFREPGLMHKGTIETESKAAVAGGITSFMEMPNCQPMTINEEALRDKRARAQKNSWANYAFYLGTTNHNVSDVANIDPQLACGVKIFMGASTGNMLVDDEKVLASIFDCSPLLIATHCEHSPTIVENIRRHVEEKGSELTIFDHPLMRSREACFRSTQMAIDLAKRFEQRLHVLHLTTEEELALFKGGPSYITAEVCVHHLFFNSTWYSSKQNLIKCNPAIKLPSDQKALQQAVNEDIISVIATDHAPHTLAEKQLPYPDAPAGVPLVQHALLTLLELSYMNIFSLEKVVQKIAHAPAELFEIKDRGFIREGYFADLVLVDFASEGLVNNIETLYSKCQWSPFDDVYFHSRVDMTLVNGHVVYESGNFSKGVVHPLAFDR